MFFFSQLKASYWCLQSWKGLTNSPIWSNAALYANKEEPLEDRKLVLEVASVNVTCNFGFNSNFIVPEGKVPKCTPCLPPTTEMTHLCSFYVSSQLHDFWRLDYWEDDLRRRRRFVRNAFGSTHADMSLKALEDYGQ